jgi:RNA polymerase sigma factor (sigma-70 family)
MIMKNIEQENFRLASEMECGRKEMLAALCADPAGLSALQKVYEDLGNEKKKVEKVLEMATISYKAYTNDAPAVKNKVKKTFKPFSSHGAKHHGQNGNGRQNGRLTREFKTEVRAICSFVSKKCSGLMIEGSCTGNNERKEEVLELLTLLRMKDSALMDLCASTGVEKKSPDCRAGISKLITAFKAMVEYNMPLAKALAKTISTLDTDNNNKIHYGYLGLMNAVNRYNPWHGVSFGSYASPWIYQSIQDNQNKEGHTIVVPHNIYALLGSLNKFTNEHRAMEGRDPTIEEICEKLKINQEKAELLLPLMKQGLSLDCLANQERASSILDTLADDSLPDVIDLFDSDKQLDNTLKMIAQLSDKARDILNMRFGINGYDRDHTLQQIGDKYGYTRERIRQLCNATIKKLRWNKKLRSARP